MANGDTTELLRLQGKRKITTTVATATTAAAAAAALQNTTSAGYQGASILHNVRIIELYSVAPPRDGLDLEVMEGERGPTNSFRTPTPSLPPTSRTQTPPPSSRTLCSIRAGADDEGEEEK